MNSTTNHSLSSIVGSWIQNPRSKRKSVSSEYIPMFEDMTLVCSGVDNNCKLMYNKVEEKYHPMYGCHRGSFCTEFRILKHQSNAITNLNSKDNLVKDFTVFRNL